MRQIELDDGRRFEVEDRFFDLPEDEQQVVLRQMAQSKIDTTPRNRPRGQPFRAFTSSINDGIANIGGGATDLLNTPNRVLDAGLEAIGSDFRFGAPFPDADDAKGVFNTIGIETDFTPQTSSEKALSKAGRVVGEGAALLAPTTKATMMTRLAGGTRFGRIVNRTFEPLRRSFAASPGAFAAKEAGALSGAAQGAALAELAAPGNEVAGVAGEVVGGLVNPTATAVKAAPTALRGAADIAGSFTRGGRERTASRALQNLVIESGENPAQVAKALRQKDLPGVNLTSGVKTGSRGLLRLEASVAKDSAEFDLFKQDQVEETFKAIRERIDRLSRSGDPNDLLTAARERDQYYNRLLSDRFETAKLRAMQVADGVKGVGKANASRQAENILRSALNDARKHERELWDQVPKEVALSADNLRETAKRLKTERLLKEETLPHAASIKRIGEGATSKELLILRSRLLNEARALRGAQNYADASIADSLADAVLKDLDGMEGDAVEAARTYSRNLHENFTQTFASRALGTNPRGGATLPPEVILDSAFSGIRGAVDPRDLRSASGFSGLLYGNQMRDMQEQWLLSAARESLEDGVANPQKLQTFLRQNGEALSDFPDVARILSDAQTASVELRNIEKLNKSASRIIRQKALFSNLLEVDNATPQISRALFGTRADRDMRQLARFAKKHGAGEGLKTAIYDSVIGRSVTSGNLDFAKLEQNFNSVSETLIKSGSMPAGEIRRFAKLVKRAAETQARVAQSFSAEELLDPPDALTDLVIRIAGARIGARAAENGAAGSSLVAASAGSRFLRGLLEKVPLSRAQDVLIEAARNPEFAAKLLEKPTTVRQARQLEQQINVFLLQAGIIAEDEDS